MIRNLPRPLTWLAFALAVAWLSMVAAPRPVTGQDQVPRTRSYFSPAQPVADLVELEPAPPSFPSSPAVTSAVGAAQAPNYWIVSSRCDVQHRNHLHFDDGDLDVYQRTHDGQLFQTNLPSLQSQMIPGVPVVICIHGTFVRWEDECIESHSTYQWLRNSCPQLPLQVIFFTWPSDGLVTGLLPADVAIRGKQAEFNGFHVARMMNCIPASCPVSFIGHSLGCRVILSTLHLAGGGDVQGMVYPGALTPHRYRAVFAAAAVDHNWMNPRQRYECALPRTECIVNLRNRRDLALAFYPLHRPFAGRALARSGLTRRDTRKLGEQSQKIINLDVTAIEGHNHLWPGYFESPEIGAAIAPYIYYPETAQLLGTSIDEVQMSPPGQQQFEQRIAPQPTPAPALDEVPAATDAPSYNPPTDDFVPGTPPAGNETTEPLAPQLVPGTP